jgi:hypothetical protein
MASEVRKKARPSSAQRFPFIPLPRAIERAKELYKIAATYDSALSTASKAWGFTEKSSGGLQTVSALKAFGLIEDFGEGDKRRIKLSDSGVKIARDPREISPERDALIRAAALLPPLHQQIVDHYKGLPPSDEMFKAHLLMDIGLRDESVDACMREFMATIRFAKIGESDMLPSEKEGSSGNGADEQSYEGRNEPDGAARPIKVGDHVQWTSNGQDQFSAPQRVNWVSEGGTHARVLGSMTGIPTGELTVVGPPRAPPVGQPKKTASSAYAGHDGELNVLLRGNRLEITADVDRAGLARLKEILGKYEEILKLIDPDPHSESI